MTDRELLEKEMEKILGKDTKSYMKDITSVLNLGDYLIFQQKRKIETHFWFAEYGYDFDEKVKLAHDMSKNENYFLHKNLAYYNSIINNLKSNNKVVLLRRYATEINVASFGVVTTREYPASIVIRQINEEEKQKIIKMMEDEKAKFEKRLRTYLKKYGLSKCRFSTYWGDR